MVDKYAKDTHPIEPSGPTGGLRRSVMAEQLIPWLLAGDVSIQYQTRRDLLDEHRPELRARIAAEGWGARYLACRKRDGSWGRGFYQPKWTSCSANS